MLSRAFAAALVASVLSASACASGDPNAAVSGVSNNQASDFGKSFSGAEAYPVFASSEITVGGNRLVVGVLDKHDAPIGSPSLEVSAEFFDLEESATDPLFARRFDFISTGDHGVYVTRATFDEAGRWGAEVTMQGDGVDQTVKAAFDVRGSSSTPEIGDPAPPSDSATAADAGELAEISTDRHPDPRFYRMSIADAVRAHKPFVVAFATPKFCTSEVCGPTLDIVKKVSKSFPKLTFVHVEVYTNLDDPANLKVVPAVTEWGLPSEPWVFVVDARGEVAAKYEGIVGRQELRKELSGL